MDEPGEAYGPNETYGPEESYEPEESYGPGAPHGPGRRQVLRAGVLGATGAAAGLAGTAGRAAAEPAHARGARGGNGSTPHTGYGPGPSTELHEWTSGWRFGGRLTDHDSDHDSDHDAQPDAVRPDFDDAGYQRVTVPHSVTDLSWHGWDPESWEHLWIYRRPFQLPPDGADGADGANRAADKRFFVDFDGVLTGATVWVNGHRLGRHLGGYLPFSHEITDHVRAGGAPNLLAVAVDSRWLSVPPGGGEDGAESVDYLQPGGIYRGVRLRAVPRTYVSDVYAKPLDVLDPSRRRVEIEATVDGAYGADGAARAARLEIELRDGDDRTVARTGAQLPSHDGTSVSGTSVSGTSLSGRATAHATLFGLSGPSGVRLWHTTDPALYDVVTTLVLDGRPAHTHRTRIGFREARFDSDGFFLNGRRLKLFGVNRHQLFPYAGMAMPDRVQRRDAQILRHELNCTMVRCSHYPQSPAFLDACDEAGLLAFEEIPGWQYVGDADWRELAVRDVAAMIRRDRNRPSVVTWGVRINESEDHPDFYARTERLAKRLDPTRATTGSMIAANHTAKGFEHDLFSYNDYPPPDGDRGALRPPLPDIPYLVTEAVGSLAGPHYYRRTDPQHVQSRQTELHADVHNRAASRDGYAGLLAWSGFDYDSLTGSVDHHLKCNGVADTFRVPKLGAAVYRAQVDPRVRAVIEPAFYWDFGPLGRHGPGDDAMICSNCERLEVYVGGRHHASVRPGTRYGHLPYPPSFVDLVLPEAERRRLPELRIDGFVDGRRVLRRRFSADPAHDALSLTADDRALTADGADATRAVFRVVDRHGSPRPYAGDAEAGDGTRAADETGAADAVRLQLDGPGELLGDDPFPLAAHGGVGAVWVRTRAGRPGLLRLTATHARLGTASAVVRSRR